MEEERSRKRGSAPTMVESIPGEIIGEILARLPAKSLCRFRCVSKSWLSTICSPQFGKAHFSLALRDKTLYSQRQKVILSKETLYSVEWESFTPHNNEIVAVEVDHPVTDDVIFASTRPLRSNSPVDETNNCLVLHLPLSVTDEDGRPIEPPAWAGKTAFEFVRVGSSCNGLLLIGAGENTRFLFNPSTRESKRIPPNPYGGRELLSVGADGFGYDAVGDDYKLVMIARAVSVYSLRAGSWRMIGDFPHDRYFMNTGVFLNGAVHWADMAAVTVFDLSQEVFRFMPVRRDDDLRDTLSTGVLNGCLCIFRWSGGTFNYFWMMREYGVATSWTRITTSFSYAALKPLCKAINGEHLLLVNGKFVLYNLEANTHVDLVVQGPSGWPVWFGFTGDTYMESVISPNGYHGMVEQN